MLSLSLFLQWHLFPSDLALEEEGQLHSYLNPKLLMLWLRIQLERQETRKRIFWKSLLEFYGIFYSPCPTLPPSCPKRDRYEYPRDPEKPWTNVNLITKESKGFDFECEVAGQREIHPNWDLSTHPQRAEGKYTERKVSWVLDMSHKGEGENQASAFPKSRLRVL